MNSLLHVVPSAIRSCTYDGTYKDIIGRVRLFESSGWVDYKQIAVSGDDPCQLDQALQLFNPTHVLIEYTYFRKILTSLRRRFPDAFIAARAINIEPLQHLGNNGLFPKQGLAWLLYGMARLWLSDVAFRWTADAVYPITEWESRMYWQRIPGRSKVKWLPYFPPDFVIGAAGLSQKEYAIACIPGKADYPRNRDAVERFIRFADLAHEIDSRYRFIITGDLSNSGIRIPEYVELPGLVPDIASFLAPMRAVAVLSPLGYGFKTTIADAVANHCYALIHSKQYRRGPALLRTGCIQLDTFAPSAVSSVLSKIETPFSEPSGGANMRNRAYEMLRNDFMPAAAGEDGSCSGLGAS